MPEPDWKREHITGLEESIRFFSNENKFDREKYVISSLLDALSITYIDSELTEAPEPTDVGFRDANFQVKEVMQNARRRGDELKAALEKAKAANTYSELLETYTPQDISIGAIGEKSVARADDLLHKYGKKERMHMDLVLYFNYLDYHEIHFDFEVPTTRDYRSLSVLSNRFAVVPYTCEEAPAFLKSAVDTLKERHIT